LAHDEVARWSAPTAHEKGDPPYECGPCVARDAGMDQAVLAQNGPVLEARSGICLLIPVYAPKTKIGAVIHLWRNGSMYPPQAELIRRVFTDFPELCDEPNVGFVSSQEINDANPVQLVQAKELVRSLAPTARLRDILVVAKESLDVDWEKTDSFHEISVEISLGTRHGQLLVQDDFGEDQTFNMNSSQGDVL
jgi:hypothetical protein